MSQTLTIKLSDKVYAAIRRRAQSDGTSPAHWVARVLEQRLEASADTASLPAAAAEQAARERFERHFGAVDLGHATGVDNEQIDADLIKAYTDNPEQP